ncbi:MAG TPA: DUF748 domain-containing protein [Steroidobacteraceae bacterium]|nr:DUF748 domain-containing protein [Steroidobacteraceae bacterium]
MTRNRKWIIGLVVVAVLLVAARLALPSIVENYANRRLGSLEAYQGHVGDIDIHLWRGAYSIDDIVIVKKGAERSVPFFRSRRTDLSIEWPSLLRGSIVATASFDQPELNLVQAENEQKSQLGEGEDWHAQLEKLFPFRFNTIQVSRGTVKFLAPGIQTRDAITARNVHGRVSNLTNVVESGKETFADFRVDADVLDGAPAKVAGSVNAFAREPTFDINLEVKKVKLPQVNPWLREYIKADAEAGDFELYLELAAADGKFKGYAKPILENVDLYRSNEAEQSALRRLWEGFLDFAANVLENDEAEQVAARIPFTGTIENPQTSLLATIASVMRNAFVSAFARSLEGSITLRDVKQNLTDLDPNQEAAEKKKDEDQDKDEKRSDARKPKPGPPGKT